MTTIARFLTEELDLVPGVPATTELLVTNHSPIVEAYTFRPMGALAELVRIEPEQISLYPDADTTVTVAVAIPRDSRVRAGEVPFAVMVQPVERPDDRVVPESLVRIGEYTEINAELTPRTSQARLWSTHLLAVDNRGNHPVQVRVAAHDPDDAVRARPRPAELLIGPGEAAFVKIRTRPRPLVWRGAPKTKPFTARVDLLNPDPDTAPVTVDGQVVQEAIIPRGAGKLVAAVAAIAAVLAGLWFGLLRPTVRSAAEDAVKKPVAQASKAAAQASKQAAVLGAVASDAAGAGGTAPGSGAGTKPTTEPTTKPSTKPSTKPPAKPTTKPGTNPAPSASAGAGSPGTPFNRHLTVTAAADQQAVASYVVPARHTVAVTDLVFESGGDTGTVQLLRDTTELMSARTQDYRTLDQHFVSPIIFTAGQKLVFQLACGTPAQGSSSCRAGIYLGGALQPVPPPASP